MTTVTNKSFFLSSFYRVKANDLVLFSILLLGIVGTAMAHQKRVGGMTGVKSFQDADAGISAEDRTQIEGFLKKVRGEAEEAAGRKFASLKPLEYATQLVNGINYFIKASTGDGKYVFLRLYKPFQGEITFNKLQDDKTEADHLTYF
ncbi:cystatin-A2 [Strongylocentrotus purpuratus]|uniref:Cystatin domain-containing protein n=1 Tax=Strongylocentrotus purpuratus TaxID=7668 RepID=A0A7M7REL2_STRPU|nr:cystatin-A2 [Strongylocentrotus purpuratus]|eukprot:XP_784732.2 PREDICTED: cystatin-A2 [Strongylocentrotus purpuratus]